MEAIEFAAASPTLSLFPIGLDVPLRCPTSGESPEPRPRGVRLEELVDREVEAQVRFVSVVFSPRIAPERTFQAGGYFSTKGPLAGTPVEDPLCLALPASPPSSIVSLEFLEALAGAKLGQPLPCILPMESLAAH